MARVQTNQQPTLLYSQNTAQKQLNWPKKLEPLHGLLHYQSLSMDLLSTKEHFMMQYACATDGDLLYYHHSLFVAGISQQNMHWAVTTIHHNEVRNIKAHLMSDVCHNVGLEPILQPITSKRLHHSTANTEDGGHVDIKAPGFSENDRQCVFFNVRVCTHLSLSPTLHLLQKTWARKEKGLWSELREVEHGCFLPLVLSASGEGPTAKMAYKKLASVVHQA